MKGNVCFNNKNKYYKYYVAMLPKKYFGKKIIYFPKRCSPNNIIYLVFLKIKVGTYFAFESTSHFFACVKLKSFRKLNIRLSVAELCESA